MRRAETDRIQARSTASRRNYLRNGVRGVPDTCGLAFRNGACLKTLSGTGLRKAILKKEVPDA